MPKINVYLPDELATRVREAGIPVSPVCQKALAEAVQAVGRARQAVDAIRDSRLDPARFAAIAARAGSRMTPRLHETLHLARGLAGPAGTIETRHLLLGLLDEGENLAVRLLEALSVDVDALRTDAAQVDRPEASQPGATSSAPPESAPGEFPWAVLSLPSRLAVASSLEAVIEAGHNYLGCEHLLLGLLRTEDSGAARALRRAGVDDSSVRRGLTTAGAGFAHAREADDQAGANLMSEILRRLEAVERSLGLAT